MGKCTRCGGSGYRLWSVMGRDGCEDLLEAWCDRCPAGKAGKLLEDATEEAEEVVEAAIEADIRERQETRRLEDLVESQKLLQ